MRRIILLGILFWPLSGIAQTDTRQAQFIDVTKYDLIIAETAGEAYGCGLRSDAWTDFTLKWVQSDIMARASAIWPEKIIVGQPIDMTNAAQADLRYNNAINLYRIGLTAPGAECNYLRASGFLGLIDGDTGYVP